MKLAEFILSLRNLALLMQASLCLLSVHFTAHPVQGAPSVSRFSLDERSGFERSGMRYTVSLNVVDDLQSPLYTLKQLRLVEASANQYLYELGDEMSRIFRYRLRRPITLNILSPAQYSAQLGGPAWTNAMYFEGVISIPLRGTSERALQSLRRSMRHEYVHAIVLEQSGGRAPAWVDEGLAQLLEGRHNSSIGPALHAAVQQRNVPALSGLGEGFLALNPESVPAAYGVSLFAVRTLVLQKGFSGIVEYLNLLAEGAGHDAAFSKVFELSPSAFEQQLSTQLERWESSGSTVP